MIYNMTAQGGITPSGTKTINISSNGTVSEDVTAFATAQVITSVPNTYSAADDGKVVLSGALVAQGSSTYTANGVYNTSLIGTVEVSVNTAPTLQSKSVAFTPAESVLTSTVTADVGYDGLNAVDITVASISSTYVGTGVARKSAADLVVSGSNVTSPAGYYSSAVSANVAAGTATTPSTLINAGVNVYIVSSTGLVSAQASSAEYVTPTVVSGYVSQGTSGRITVYDAAYFNLPTQAASTITPTTASQLAVSSYHWTTGSVYVAPIPSAYIVPTGTSNITANATGIDIASYASVNVNVPNSYSAGDAGKVVSGTSLVAQTTSTYTANGSYNTTTISGITISINTAPTLQTKSEAYTPAETVITDSITPDAGYDGLNQVDITVNAISSTYVGTGVARKSSADLTALGSVVTAPSGYYSSGASMAVTGGTATTPATTITTNPAITVNASGLITATNTGTSNITPTVTAGYISVGTAGTVTVSGTKTSQLTTQAGTTITPSTASQLAVASGRYTTGSVYVGPIPSTYIVPTGTSNITANATGIDIASYASVNVSVPNSYSAADEGKVVSGSALVAQTTSTYTTNGGYNTTTISSITINVQPALQSKSVSFTPASTVQTSSVTPGTGYYGLSKVDITVDAIPSAYVIPTGTLSITNNGSSIAVGSYAYVDVDVAGGGGGSVLISDTIDPICGGTIREITASAFTVETLSVSSNGTYSASSGVLWDTVSVSVSGGITPTGTSTINVTANGTTTHDVTAFASAQVIANVPNSYSAADEGKVVYGSALSAQTTATYSSNATYDTTLISQVTVNVSGGGTNRETEIIMHTLSGTYENTTATSIYSTAFENNPNLMGVIFANCTEIGAVAFRSCFSLLTADFPSCITIGSSAFMACSSLTTISFPVCEKVRTRAFNTCRSLQSVILPMCSAIESYAFGGCYSLSFVSLPKLVNLSSYVFTGCSSLATFIIGHSNPDGSLWLSGTMNFSGCWRLFSVYLLASSMYSLGNPVAFSSTPISTYTTYTGGVNGSIFVKSSLYDTYISATNWATYADRIVSLTDAQVANVIANGTHVI